MPSSKRQKKDHVHEPEDADISSPPEELDNGITIAPSVIQHEEILQDRRRAGKSGGEKQIKAREERKRGLERTEAEGEREENKRNEKTATRRTPVPTHRAKRIAEKTPKSRRKAHTRGKMLPTAITSKHSLTRYNGPPPVEA